MPAGLKFCTSIKFRTTVEKLEKVLESLDYFRAPTSDNCWVKASSSQSEDRYGGMVTSNSPIVVVFSLNAGLVEELTVASSSSEKMGSEAGQILAKLA